MISRANINVSIFRSSVDYFDSCVYNLSIRKLEIKSFIAALLLVTIAKIQIVFGVTYSVDDYYQIIYGLDSLSRGLINQGRFGEYWLSKAFSYIGYEPVRAPLLSTLASIFLSTWVANAVLRLWRVDLPDFARSLCIFVIAAHPYTSEILTFREVAIYHVVALSLAFAAMLIARPTLLGIIIPSLLLSFALSIYQVPVSFISVFICFDIAIGLIVYLLGDSKITNRDYELVNIAASRIAVFISGTAIYLLWLKMMTRGISPHPRSLIVPPNEFPERIAFGSKLLWSHFVSGNAYANSLVPVPVLAILLILIGLSALEFGLQVKSWRRVVPGIAIVVAAPLLAAYAVLGLPLFAKSLMLLPRMLSQIGLVWAGVGVTALLVSREGFQKLVVGMLAVAAFAFIALGQGVLVDHARVNVRDHNLAMRILFRLEQHQGFADVRRIAIFGTRRDQVSVPTAIHPKYSLNNSSFSAWWSIGPMITELSGTLLTSAGAKERGEAANYCRGRAPWPSSESVVVRHELAIVCL